MPTHFTPELLLVQILRTAGNSHVGIEMHILPPTSPSSDLINHIRSPRQNNPNETQTSLGNNKTLYVHP
ncbi:hypothetical protein RP20_CCG013929 [Aedes albopictus]|nr:hypothetical protein RP20_CCG013929 [Aedes albopictus]